MRRWLGPVVSVLLLLGVGYAVMVSLLDGGLQSLTTVKGIGGSEKQDFFADERVVARFAELGYEVTYRKAGSRQIATNYDLNEYDFAFPAGVPAAEKIRRNYATAKTYTPFFTPMAIASWQPIAELLVANGIARNAGAVASGGKNGNKAYYWLDMQKYAEAVKQKTRWQDLANNNVFPVSKAMLINSTDIRKSNSAAMYLALMSYVLNNNQVVYKTEQINAVAPWVTDVFVRQGFVENSSAVPFEDYLVMGMGKAPMVMIYEAQFIQRAAQADGSMTDDMVLIYPQPTIFTKHTLVAFSESAAEVGHWLENDPTLLKLATEYGLRNSNMGYFREFTQKNQVSVAPNLVDVIEPPAYETVEALIQQVEQAY